MHLTLILILSVSEKMFLSSKCRHDHHMGAGWGGGGVRRCLVNFQCQGVLLTWLTEGQGPIVLSVGAGGVVWTFLSHLSLPFSFSLSVGDGPI